MMKTITFYRSILLLALMMLHAPAWSNFSAHADHGLLGHRTGIAIKSHLIGEYDKDNKVIQETLYLGDLPVAVVKPNATGALDLYYLHADHLNAPRAILKSNAAGTTAANTVVWRWPSDAFGVGLPLEYPDHDGQKFTYNLRFPGQYTTRKPGCIIMTSAIMTPRSDAISHLTR